MQIIGGKFRGKKLEWVSNATTRPTTSRAKENIFNILTSMGVNFGGMNVLVLFAGSGQMGLECYSRGAKSIVFNDTSPEAQKVIQKNSVAMGFVPEVSSFDYMTCLSKLHGQKFDLVFLDPPFADLDAAPNAARFLRVNDMLSETAVIVAETENPDLVFENFNVRLKKYGRAQIYFLTI